MTKVDPLDCHHRHHFRVEVLKATRVCLVHPPERCPRTRRRLSAPAFTVLDKCPCSIICPNGRFHKRHIRGHDNRVGDRHFLVSREQNSRSNVVQRFENDTAKSSYHVTSHVRFALNQ